MPEDVREILKQKIGYVYKKDEKLEPVPKIDWKTKIPGMDERTYQIWEWFDEQWNKRGCRLMTKTTDQIIEYNDKLYSRGEFTKFAKSLTKGE